MKFFPWGTVLLAAITLSACSTAPVKLDGNSFFAESRHPSAVPEPLPDACPVRIRNIQDARAHKASLGWVAGRSLEAENFPRMVRAGLVHGLTQSRSVRIVQDGSEIESAITVDGKVLKAYMKSVSTSMVANVAMRIHFTMPDGRQDSVTIRGQDISVNWASGDGEIKESLSLALIDVAKQAQRSLAKHCEQLDAELIPENISLR